MRSVRFDAELDNRVERAAQRRGVTVSDFIRVAVRKECDSVLEAAETVDDWKAIFRGSPNGEEWIRLLDGIVGSIEGDGTSAEEHKDDWARSIRERNFRD